MLVPDKRAPRSELEQFCLVAERAVRDLLLLRGLVELKEE
jgi:hypothetical protein